MAAISIAPYKVGDPLVTTGQKIAEIVGQTDSSGVYITVDGHIRWEYYADSRVPDRLVPAIRKLEELTLIVRRTYRQGHRDDARRELANALRSALETPAGADPLDAFKGTEASLGSQYARKAGTYHVAGSTCSMLAFSGAGLLVYYFSPEEASLVSAGAIAGAIGALISVLLRIKNLEISAAPLWYWCVEGIFRTMLGAIFGGVLILLVKGNIVLGLAAQNPYACYAVSLVAGFSERLVPSILKQIEDSQLDAVRKKEETSPAGTAAS